MTQQLILDALDNLMPEVVSTNNPEATLLKFAKTNNLYPTQLEKLGHAFNQCKTLVGLSKQANRGDSFSILNVPEMITKYSTYKPSDVLTKEEKKVHKQVDKIVKSAGVKVASGGRLPMPDFMDRLVARGAEVIDNDVTEKALVPSNSAFDVLFNKKASADEEVVVVDEDELLSEYEKYEKEKKDAEETEEFINNLEEVKTGLDEVIKTKCASVAQYLRKKGPQAWVDVVEDSVLRFGIKSAAAINTIENYLEVNHIPYNTANVDETIFTKYAFVEDRHNMFNLVSEVNDCLEEKCLADELILEKIATFQLPPIPPAPPSLDTDFNLWSKQLADAIKTGKQEGHNFLLVKDKASLNSSSKEVKDAYDTYLQLRPDVLDTKLIAKIISSELKRHAKNKKLLAEGKAILSPEFDQDSISSYLTSNQRKYLDLQWEEYNESIKLYLANLEKEKAEKAEIAEKEKAEKETKEYKKSVDKATDEYIKQLGNPGMDAFKSGFGLAKSTVTGVKDAVKGFKTGAKDTHQFVKDLINKLPDYDYNKNFSKIDTALSKDFNLHKLILTDPVIAEADPQEVSEIYNTIAEISPRFALNTRLMSTALKEALQYGAVPLNMLKDISEFEKNMRGK